MNRYDHKEIEKKWQDKWEEAKVFEASDTSEKPKFFALIEFPFASGEGMHMGHLRSNTAMDVISRKRRAEGYNVLYPIGWDAFGLPTENYAIKTGKQPSVITKDNTDNFRLQLKRAGFSFDWTREVNTSDPSYYKWTQWIFLQFFKKGLAYKKKMSINWCPKDKIGLANEEVMNGLCERCGTAVEKRDKEQWMLAITKYADRLDKDLDTVNYLENIKTQQRNWIGRSEGAEISFKVIFEGGQQSGLIPVFTTRADTLFGVTYMVLSPEHPWVTLAVDENHKGVIKNVEEVRTYIAEAKKKDEITRTDAGKVKTGVELKGVKAVNPATGEEIPMFVADYVLAHYGTGAVMAVPAHDERDFEFAKKYNLSIKKVVEPVFIQETEPGKVRKDLPVEEREAIIAIVKHWSEDKYIGLKWKEVAWGTFITGGIEEGQTAEEAAKMEILEETGFLHPKLVADFGILHGKFYHVPKKVNRFAHASTLLFRLEDDQQKEVLSEEKAKHEVVWLSRAELQKFLTPATHFRALDILNGIEFYSGEGILVNSGKFDGQNSVEAEKDITKTFGQAKITFKLKDWIFSRQRYWGEPIPLVYCENCAQKNATSKNSENAVNAGWIAIPEKDLPVTLPHVENYQPTDTGESPLSDVPEWVNTKCPDCGGPARRETDTMPNWAGSSWYYLRYVDPKNDQEFASKKLLQKWTPVDWYNGGMEHVTLHLLYSRFWHKFLFDLGFVPTAEPYTKRTAHGLILAADGEKMSKSRGNVVNPDEFMKTYGADALRLYEMFIGPFDQAVTWNDDGIVGVYRFLERVWRLQEKVATKKSDDTVAQGDQKTETLLHQTIAKVSSDIEGMHFNTAISAMMILANEFEKLGELNIEWYKALIQMLAPFAPHIAEELWTSLKNIGFVHETAWPKADVSKLQNKQIVVVIQVNGRVRSQFEASLGISEIEANNKAISDPNIKKYVDGKTVKKVIFVPNKLINIVVTE